MYEGADRGVQEEENSTGQDPGVRERSIKDYPCGQCSGDEMGNGKKRDQETEGSRSQKL